jgi:hypothetical protein
MPNLKVLPVTVIFITFGVMLIGVGIFLPQIAALQQPAKPQAIMVGGLAINVSTDKFYYGNGETIRWSTNGWTGNINYVVKATLKNPAGTVYGSDERQCYLSCGGAISIPSTAPQGSYYVEVECVSIIPNGTCPSGTAESAFFDIQPTVTVSTTTTSTSTTLTTSTSTILTSTTISSTTTFVSTATNTVTTETACLNSCPWGKSCVNGECVTASWLLPLQGILILMGIGSTAGGVATSPIRLKFT